jgi:hypothetical protein
LTAAGEDPLPGTDFEMVDEKRLAEIATHSSTIPGARPLL